MDAARIELKLVLGQAGIDDPKLDTFSERFNIQKRVYLIQLLGYDLGYRFGWYLRGPYSRELTADAFTLRDELQDGEKDFDEYLLADDGKERISRARQLWELPAGADIGQDEWLELLASLHYLKHIVYWKKASTKDFDAVFAKLIDAKPQFSGSHAPAQNAWDRLEACGLIANKSLA